MGLGYESLIHEFNGYVDYLAIVNTDDFHLHCLWRIVNDFRVISEAIDRHPVHFENDVADFKSGAMTGTVRKDMRDPDTTAGMVGHSDTQTQSLTEGGQYFMNIG